MCYEFSGWHWQGRAKELHKAQVKSRAEESKGTVATSAEDTERKRAEVKQPEKMPA